MHQKDTFNISATPMVHVGKQNPKRISPQRYVSVIWFVFHVLQLLPIEDTQ